jgi:hypothetical protein
MILDGSRGGDVGWRQDCFITRRCRVGGGRLRG